MIVRRLLPPPVIAGAIIVLAVAVVGGFIKNPLPVDTAVWSDFIASRTPAMNSFMAGASWLFDPKRAVALAFAVAAAVWWLIKKVMHALYILCSVALSGVNGYLIKHIDARPRPDEAFRVITEDSYSFPSGHATSVTALVISLVLVLTMTRLCGPGVHRIHLRDAPVSGRALGDGRSRRLRRGPGFVDDSVPLHAGILRAEKGPLGQRTLLTGAPGALCPGRLCIGDYRLCQASPRSVYRGQCLTDLRYRVRFCITDQLCQTCSTRFIHNCGQRCERIVGETRQCSRSYTCAQCGH